MYDGDDSEMEEMRRRRGRRRRRRRRRRVGTKKQEPHTEMWGKNTPAPTAHGGKAMEVDALSSTSQPSGAPFPYPFTHTLRRVDLILNKAETYYVLANLTIERGGLLLSPKKENQAKHSVEFKHISPTSPWLNSLIVIGRQSSTGLKEAF